MNEYVTSMLSQSRIDASIRAAFTRGEQKGIAQGRIEGMNKAKEEIVRKMQEGWLDWANPFWCLIRFWPTLFC